MNRLQDKRKRKEVIWLRIDLGSGKHKHDNCIGIDRRVYDSTDIVHDYNLPIPLKDNSVDLVMCSHSLQYVHDLNQVMQDIYRICRHKAIVCIVAPYAHATIHLANPEIKQHFNEHSPKYWTNAPEVIWPVDGDLLLDTDGVLAERQVLEPIPVDFRLLRMEFFYFPTYQGLYSDMELSLLRQSQLNVAYQIMYHLVVIKESVSAREFAELSKAAVLEEPDYIEKQRGFTDGDSVLQENKEQPFNLDHMRSFSSENVESDHPSPELAVDQTQQKLPLSQKGGKGKRQTMSRNQKRRVKLTTNHRKKKKRSDSGKHKTTPRRQG